MFDNDIGTIGILQNDYEYRCIPRASYIRCWSYQYVRYGIVRTRFTSTVSPDVWPMGDDMEIDHEKKDSNDTGNSGNVYRYVLSGICTEFLIRIRTIGQSELMEPTRLFPIMAAMRKFLQQKFGFLVPTVLISSPITSGAVFIFWSWISLAFSDVGAYFVGRKFGKTKLGQISPAAGATSPNKSVEGVIGGCIASSLFSIAGAWAQKWPHFILTGLVHGTLLALLGLIGDLTASMLKRDAGLKDFGNLIPEHGGIMDRVDSFIWTAPYSFLVINFVLPAIMK